MKKSNQIVLNPLLIGNGKHASLEPTESILKNVFVGFEVQLASEYHEDRHTGWVWGLCCCTSLTSASVVHDRSLHTSWLWSSTKSHIYRHCKAHLNGKGCKRLACGPLPECLSSITHSFKFMQVPCIVKYAQINCSQWIILSLVAFSKISLNFIFNLFIFVCVCAVCVFLVCECGHACATAYVWKSEDNLGY